MHSTLFVPNLYSFILFSSLIMSHPDCSLLSINPHYFYPMIPPFDWVIRSPSIHSYLHPIYIPFSCIQHTKRFSNTHNKNKNKNKTTHDTPIAVFDAIPETTTAKTQAGFPTNSKIRCDSSQIACVMNRFPSSTLPIRSLRAVSHFALVASFSFPRLSAKSCGPAVLQRANCPARNRGVVWIRFYR